MTPMIMIFWILFFLIIYCYFGYPFLIWTLARLKPWPVNKAGDQLDPDNLPFISIVMAVHNEADVIVKKITNLLSLDYPTARFEILIGSDGSTDQTDSLITKISSGKKLNPSLLRLISNSLRQGKISILNHLVPLAKGDIIVFTDARQILATDALRKLASNFQDPRVGCVSGELMFVERKEETGGTGGTGSGVNLYWKYEKFIRHQESRLHSMLGATGAIYAIRKNLYTPPPQEVVLDDMFIPLNIILQGYRAVFDGEAKAFDQVADKPKEEYTRKVRTLFGNYQIFSIMPEIFNPLRSPVAFQMISHKLLRVLAPFFMIGVFIINLFFLNSDVFKIIFAVQILFYCLAGIGSLAGKKNCGILNPILRISYVPYVFCLLNFSALAGFVRFIRGTQNITWVKARKV